MGSLIFSTVFPLQTAQAQGSTALDPKTGQVVNIDTGEPIKPVDRAACLSDLSWIGFANCVTGFVYIFTVGLGGAVAWVGATFLNFAVHLSLNSGAYALDFVATGWTTARDIANMAFIFILIYLAVTIMFQANTSGTMHTLASVVVVALIINFSFFLTRVVIDAGNILSTQFYNAIIAEGSTAQTSSIIGVIPVPDITAGIMNGVDLQTALSSDSFKSFANSSNNFNDFVPYTIAMSFVFIAVGAMFFMLAASFLTAGVKFLMRIVVLWFMIIASPLALAARASGMRQFEHYYHEWRNNLISHAFYPVAFLFVFWILTQFMSGAGAGGYVTNLFNGLNTTTGNQQDFLIKTGTLIAELGIRLGFVIAMIYIAVQAAGRFGTFGASAAEKFGQRFSLGGLAGYTKGLRWAGNRFVARPASALASQPIGGAASLSNNLLRRSGALNQNGVLGDLARGTSRNVLQPLTKTSFAGEKSYSKLMADAREKDKTVNSRSVLSDAVKLSDKELSELSEEKKKEINKLGANMFLGVSEDQIARLADLGVLNEATGKKIHDSEDFSEDAKHHVEHAIEEAKSREQIKLLSEINTKLGELNTNTDEGNIELKNLLKKGMKFDKKNTGILKKAFQEKLDQAQNAHKEAELRLQQAVIQQTEARKRGSTAAEKAAVDLINEAKRQMIEAKSIERTSSDGMKKLEKPAPKEEKKDSH